MQIHVRSSRIVKFPEITTGLYCRCETVETHVVQLDKTGIDGSCTDNPTDINPEWL
ncbi:hypothetical protein D3C86_2072200 [compost metagenome]